MAIRYTISRWDSSTAMQARAFHAVSRSDAAENRLWAEIYAMLESAALLDRPAARRLLAEFEASAMNGDFKAPKLGYERYQVFKLRDDTHGMLEHVIFRAERV
jgi:hypothetical protein